MKRLPVEPRDGWQSKVADVGLVYNTLPDGRSYWNESTFYELTVAEVDALEAATNSLHEMCLQAAQHVIDANRFVELGIPEKAIPAIKWAWDEEPPAIYGRFDLSYDGQAPPKLLEYNADTPTSLLEASIVQWNWLNDVAYPRGDQFNSIHERLIQKWKELRRYLTGSTLYFAHIDDDSLEDTMTVTYMRDTALAAGIKDTAPILMKDIGWDADRRRFVDLENRPIMSAFKLYPWEWLISETFGEHAIETYRDMQWIEPIWKMLLSNKGILGVLWELFPDHPNLLEARLGDPGGMRNYIRKPLLSREGANVRVVQGDAVVCETDGDYGEEGYVFQQWHEAEFDGRRPVIGSWVIDGQSAGIGIRETGSLVTDNLSSFVPHVFHG